MSRNQVVYIGNPYVWADKGLEEMICELQMRVSNPEKIAFVLVHGQGRYIRGPHGIEVCGVTLLNDKITVPEKLSEENAHLFLSGTFVPLSTVGEKFATAHSFFF